MNKFFSIVFIIVLFGFKPIGLEAQFLFVDEKDWLIESGHISQYYLSEVKAMTVPETVNQDTSTIVYKYNSNQTAIEGQYHIDKNKNNVKSGTWLFYYPSGNLWSERVYNDKGALIEIKQLLKPDGSVLETGFPHQNKDGSHYGHVYQYDINGNLAHIARYSKGYLTEIIDKDKYTAEELKRPQIREYKIDDNNSLRELSFDEAVEAQKADPKHMFIHATTSWNGYSRRGIQKVFTDPMIASRIKDHFHFVYFDIQDTKDITINHNGETITYKGAEKKSRGYYHELFKVLGKGLGASTPIFMLVDENLNVIGHSVGIEITPEKFMPTLDYFIEGHYLNSNYKTYKASLESDK